MWVVHFTFMFFCNCPNKICFYDKRERGQPFNIFSRNVHEFHDRLYGHGCCCAVAVNLY